MSENVPNVNFLLNYVETMRGRDSNDKYLKEHLEERRFYSSIKDDDYLKYVNKGSNENLDYVEYSGNKEKSHGVFNEKGLMTSEMIKEMRTMLRNTDSPIWHGVISFTQEFGETYCNTFEKAFELMKNELPKFFKNAGLIPENIVWYAGLHENTDNKHIHLSFFEKEPLRNKQGHKEVCFSDGIIPIKAINRFKIRAEIRLLQITKEIQLARKTLTDEMKKDMKLGDYMKHINSLYFSLPHEHRMSYDSENIKPYKEQIDMVVNAIIMSNEDLQRKFNDFQSFIVKRDYEIKEAYKRINVDYKDKLLFDKCIDDIYRRLGNIVLRTIRDIRWEQRKVEYETTKRLALKRIEKNKRKIMLNRCLKLNELVNREIINAFQEYREKLQDANFKRLKEEGLLD